MAEPPGRDTSSAATRFIQAWGGQSRGSPNRQQGGASLTEKDPRKAPATDPTGRKTERGREEASGGYIPRPPSQAELDAISEAQSLITDEWTGEPRTKDKAKR